MRRRRWLPGLLIGVAVLVGCSAGGGGAQAHGAGRNVVHSSVVSAVDVHTGKLRWQTNPPGVGAREFVVNGHIVTFTATHSDHRCEFQSVRVSTDVLTGQVLRSEITDDGVQSIESLIPPIVEAGVTIRYLPPGQPGATPPGRPGQGFPSAAPQAEPAPAVTLPGGVVKSPMPAGDTGQFSGLVGQTRAGAVLWADTVAGEDGAVLLQPPVHGAGVVAANFGGGNNVTGHSPTSVLVLGASTGRLLWQLANPTSAHAIAIDPPNAYVLTAGQLQARNLLTGKVAWSVPTSADAVVADSAAVVGSSPTGPTTAYDSSGRRLWSLTRGSQAPLGAGAGLVYLTTPGQFATRCDE